MDVPGTAALEEVRKWSSVFSSHVSFERRGARVVASGGNHDRGLS